MKTVVVPIELPAAAHALLQAVAIQQGAESVGEHIANVVMGDTAAFCAAHSDPNEEAIQELFTIQPTKPKR